MKNPLNRRFARELRQDLVKYGVIFIFMTGVIGSVSGFMVANHSLVKALRDNYGKYAMEDGNFELAKKASGEMTRELEKSMEKVGLKLYPNFYAEAETVEVSSTLRVFSGREQVNRVCLMEGRLPAGEEEMALDRMYACNNSLRPGDRLTLGEISYTISGLIALPDYSALYQNPADMMFDASKFGVAYVTAEGMERFDEGNLVYSYSWKYADKPLSDEEAGDRAEDLMAAIREQGGPLKEFIPAYENQAMIFVEDDIVKDNRLFQIFLYTVVIIVAFIFAITSGSTITQEANVIGTLRASGFSRREMLCHYMAMPGLVLIISALTGNLLGYTIFKDYMVEIYYKSYSLTTHKTLWNGQAFVRTTVIPTAIMLSINFVMLRSKLSLSPLRFIRRDLRRGRKRTAVYLKETWGFKTRFRIRTLLQNIPNYAVIFAGIVFAVFIMLFGMMFTPVMDNFERDITQNMLCRYQYVLKYPAETSEEKAEKYCVTLLMTREGRYKSEEVTIYGIQPGSRYCNVSPDPGKVFISGAYAEKYAVEIGEKITLTEKFEDQSYIFEVQGFYPYPSTMAVFMSREMFWETFHKEPRYFNGYLSDVKLTDLEETAVATVITEDDLTKTSRQMRISLGGFVVIFQIFGAVMFSMIIYLLSKVIIDKNSQAISMLKILGYSGKEISRLYVWGTSVVVVLSAGISLPLANRVMARLFTEIFAAYPGWITYRLPPSVFGQIGIMTVGLYGVVLAVQMRKVRRIPMEDALKNVE